MPDLSGALTSLGLFPGKLDKEGSLRLPLKPSSFGWIPGNFISKAGKWQTVQVAWVTPRSPVLFPNLFHIPSVYLCTPPGEHKGPIEVSASAPIQCTDLCRKRTGQEPGVLRLDACSTVIFRLNFRGSLAPWKALEGSKA